jgi:hypothetical protein
VPVHDNIYDNISTTNDEYCTGGLCGLLWRALVDEIGHGRLFMSSTRKNGKNLRAAAETAHPTTDHTFLQ